MGCSPHSLHSTSPRGVGLGCSFCQLWVAASLCRLIISILHPDPFMVPQGSHLGNALHCLAFSSVQSLSCVRLCDPMDCSMPGFPVHHQFPELTQTHVHRVSDAIQPSHPLLPLLLLPSIFPSIRVFSNQSVLHIRWPKYWSFSISPCNDYSGLVSFRIDWFDLLAVQGTLKSLQHHSLKASILWHSSFFIVQVSHPYMTTGKTVALTI